VTFELENARTIDNMLSHIRHVTRNITERAIGYQLFRHKAYLNNGAVDISESHIRFSFRRYITSDYQYDTNDPCNIDSNYRFDFDISCDREYLCIRLIYDAARYDARSARQLMDDYARTLHMVIDHCSSMETSEIDPADFPLVSVDQRA